MSARWFPTNLFSRLLVGMLVTVQMGCDQRFSAERIYSGQAGVEPKEESVKISESELGSFRISEVIQYLKFHEQMNWSELTEQELTGWVEKFPKDPMVLELASDFYLSHEDIDQALLYNSQAENEGARSVEFYRKRSQIFAAHNDYGLAIDYINKAVAINGSDPDIYLSKGEVYLKLGDSLSALSNKQRAFNNDSTRLDIAADLAFLYAHKMDRERAFGIIEWLDSQDYRPEKMGFLKASLHRKSGNDQLANNELSTLLAQGKSAAGVSLLNYFRENNQYDSIIYYASKVLELDSLNLMAMEAKAFSFDRKGYFGSALLYYNQMLDVDSLSEEAQEGIRKVNGKIAYLRKLREQREAIPNFDFASPAKRNELIDE